MAENSGIEWTHHTFNPWIGCTKVSAACDYCYAESWATRFRHGEGLWNGHRARTSAANWQKPLTWNRQAAGTGERPRVFCASLADVFDNQVPDEWIDDLWGVIDQCRNLDWLLLTKRPQNIKKKVPWFEKCWPHVWLGTTVENQEEADRRIPHLLSVPARVHFLSCEPLLGPVNLRRLSTHGGWYDALAGYRDVRESPAPEGQIGWVIAGGESGPDFRHADPDWFRSLRDQCAEVGVPFLFKQWEGVSQKAIKALGRELDGVVHDGYPKVAA